ncbi:hypothetical protein COM13_20060 [Bacillus pseudomycoides]|nr:hypothetical protein COO07_16265 [Bacillus pseudomycoides]PDY10596.1 hypothetical protein COO16_19375 [Bacillus pseudomycoides]PEB42704.1 hypothetical protein COO06_05825 [Bacillus pseudomycoides]PEF75252.1 hypothetical protein CON94_11725 [Bacillus pseudomycoides]PEI49666.1 hypothetical protein CN641_05540 [Bacillus pseudomycoides]
MPIKHAILFLLYPDVMDQVCAYYIMGGAFLFPGNVTPVSEANFYPALTGSKTPTSKFSESKEVRWGTNCP